ncbi:metallophosphoesterase [Pontibacter sp. G13]|uniref:metallophosphoesterase n=1 Tax=Pontibacter sp. G13 TaxID=3074898 RepID=UPI00288B48E1|nr:metallophosphoesterase [Pontibacter sp. G13]WNJ19370.1 metallophosphoesterase [Pontibacter sp. G13]
MNRTPIPKPVGRRFAIPDIHGCLKTFQTVLYDRLQVTRDDQIFLLGDYVHRGPDSAGVLDELVHLIEHGYQIFPIRGNHDDDYIEEMGASLPSAHLALYESMPYFRLTEEFIFVHANLNYDAQDPFSDTATMKWGTRFEEEPDLEFLEGRRVIHGHVIHPIGEIFDAIHDGATILPLDNGCYKGLKSSNEAYGTLLALNLDTMELMVQPCVDEKVVANSES